MVLSFPNSTFVIVASAEDYHNTWVLIEAVAGDKRQQGGLVKGAPFSLRRNEEVFHRSLQSRESN